MTAFGFATDRLIGSGKVNGEAKIVYRHRFTKWNVFIAINSAKVNEKSLITHERPFTDH